MACKRSSNRPAAAPCPSHSLRNEPTVHGESKNGAQAAEGVRFWGGDWRNCRGRNSYGMSQPCPWVCERSLPQKLNAADKYEQIFVIFRQRVAAVCTR